MSENQWGLGGMEIQVKEQEDYLMAWVHNIPCLLVSLSQLHVCVLVHMHLHTHEA